MADEWTPSVLGDDANLLTGFPFKSSEYVTDSDGIKLLRGDNVVQGMLRWDGVKLWSPNSVDGLQQYSLEDGDVVLAMDRPWIEAGLKYAAISEHDLPCLLVQRVARLRGGAALDGGYLRYLIGSRAFTEHVLAVQTGTAVPHISGSQIKAFRYERPPLREQQAIACILGALDDKIELNRRRNRTLEAMARAIFQSWFVDFDPVKAKAAGRTPPGLSPALAALFPDSFTDSPLGPIPTGWRVGTVGDVADFNAWTLGKRDDLDVIDYIEISEVMRGEIANITRYTRGTEPGRARRRLRHGDTAISTVRPDRGSYFLSIEPSPNVLASTGFAVLTAKNCHWAFAHVLVTRDEFGQELGRLADGGAYPAVRPEVIAARPVVIPAKSELLTNFEKAARPLLLHADLSRKESRSLAALRDALLPKLISGELRVPDAERIVGREL